jgi:hypothetical protein
MVKMPPKAELNTMRKTDQGTVKSFLKGRGGMAKGGKVKKVMPARKAR